MGITFERVWDCEKVCSPGVALGAEAQLLKVGEEFGEVCDALLKRDVTKLKDETADLLNTVFGFSLHVFKDPEEMSQKVMEVIQKMSEKYGRD